jgi:hypothetical protein
MQVQGVGARAVGVFRITRFALFAFDPLT